ncbi:hypothetical protein, partial [Gemmatimonas sp.]|uniref:hypothetical protein n=1 Tax=Gemmatimonas sp. TaxID=1962908 RepID=UPI003561EAE6
MANTMKATTKIQASDVEIYDASIPWLIDNCEPARHEWRKAVTYAHTAAVRLVQGDDRGATIVWEL